jgi:long-subunit acyl-CoA synthetase (AMP-forming)
LPNLEAKVVDQNGQILPRGQTGEILIRNPFAMKGYLNGSIATNEVFTDDGYIKTGDVGIVNQSGRWYIIGRLKVSTP